MKIGQIADFIDSIAPPVYQESYDNARLIVGDKEKEINSALISLDTTENVVDEAIEKGCGLIVSHHPIIFTGIKSLNSNSYVGRTIIKAVKNDIAILAVHTNLDNVYYGVNHMIAEKIGLKSCSILTPKNNTLKKLSLSGKVEEVADLEKQIFKRSETQHFQTNNIRLTSENEAIIKSETVFSLDNYKSVFHILKKIPDNYGINYEVSDVVQPNPLIGSGMLGELEEEKSEIAFLEHLKNSMNLEIIRHTRFTGKNIKRVALCGGSGSFLLKDAIKQNADIFITADFKYHQFFDADGKIVIADIGHYESEKYTSLLIERYLSEKFPNFAVYLSKVNTNPVKYFN